MSTPLVFIDTETTGVHPGRQVWDVAMIRRDDERTDDERSFFVEVDLSEADPFGLNVGRFYERHPAGRWLSAHGGPTYFPTPGDVAAPSAFLSQASAAQAVARFTHGAHLVGAVPIFDAEVLSKLLREFGLIPAWHYHLVDVEAMAAGRLGANPPWKSDDLAAHFDVEPAADHERHTAIGDARWVKRWYDALVGGDS